MTIILARIQVCESKISDHELVLIGIVCVLVLLASVICSLLKNHEVHDEWIGDLERRLKRA